MHSKARDLVRSYHRLYLGLVWLTTLLPSQSRRAPSAEKRMALRTYRQSRSRTNQFRESRSLFYKTERRHIFRSSIIGRRRMRCSIHSIRSWCLPTPHRPRSILQSPQNSSRCIQPRITPWLPFRHAMVLKYRSRLIISSSCPLVPTRSTIRHSLSWQNSAPPRTHLISTTTTATLSCRKCAKSTSKQRYRWRSNVRCSMQTNTSEQMIDL